MINKVLKTKIVEKFGTNRNFSRASGIDESTLTKILRGAREPTEKQKSLIAMILRVKKNTLFDKKNFVNFPEMSKKPHVATIKDMAMKAIRSTR